jgi:NADH-quinone oxidoreductase subunit A
VPAEQAAQVVPGEGDAVREMAQTLATFSLIDILVFFAVLMVGFFYVWKRGDLDWVRTISRQRAQPVRGPSDRIESEPVIVA